MNKNVLNKIVIVLIILVSFCFTSFSVIAQTVDTSANLPADENRNLYSDTRNDNDLSNTRTSNDSSDTRASNSSSDTRSSGSDDDEDNSNTSTNGIFTLKNPLKVDSIGGLIGVFVEAFTYLVIIFAVLMFIYLGFQYITASASGNASKIKELHSKFAWLVIGVAIVIGARVIIGVIINTLSATGTVSPGVIQSANDALNNK